MIEASVRGNLKDGTKLTAKYKGVTHEAVMCGNGGGATYRLKDGREFSSPSGAGKAVTGSSVNGWRFWTVAE